MSSSRPPTRHRAAWLILALAAVCAPCASGCGAFASLAEDSALLVVSPNYARQGDTATLELSFPELDVERLRQTRVAALDFGPLVSARSLQVHDDGSMTVDVLVARGAPLGQRTVRITLAHDSARDVTAEATFFIVRPRAQ